jgi:predicted ribosomally synthesized peptide with SipW-like signal peptide
MNKSKLNSLVRNKKLLYSLILFTSIILLSSAATYSWFTASVVSNGKVQVGTFKLSINTGNSNSNENEVMFDIGSLQPGASTVEKTIEFINLGSIDMILQGNLSLTASENNYYNGVGPIGAYRITAKFYKNNETDPNNFIYAVNNVEANENMIDINNEVNNKLDPKEGIPMVFKPNEKLICKFQIDLDSALAKNIHQGDSLAATLQVNARQNVVGAAYNE